MAIDTGTVCPFPMAWPSSMNFSSDPADCTETYAQRLGAAHVALQVVLCVVSFACFFGLLFRMTQLRRYAHAQHQRWRDQPSFFFMVFGLMFLGLFSLENLDVFAFHGWYPAELYYVLDELVAASLIACAVVAVDFWVRLARGIGNEKQGLPAREKWLILFCVFANFFGWIVVGVSDPSRFYLYESIKSFGGSVILLGFLYRSGMAVYKLHRTLSKSGSSGSAGTTKQMQSTRKAARVLLRKFGQFSVILLVAALALLVNGVLALRLDEGMDWRWKVVLDKQYDEVQIVLRAVYLLGALAVVSFFRVPQSRFVQENKSSAASRAGGGGGGGNNNNTTGLMNRIGSLLSVKSEHRLAAGGELSPMASTSHANLNKKSLRVSQISVDGMVEETGEEDEVKPNF